MPSHICPHCQLPHNIAKPLVPGGGPSSECGVTSRDVQRRILCDRYRRSSVCVNYTPAGWYECDVFEITQAGLTCEYEIKLTASDFKADAAKQNRHEELTKHDKLSKGSSVGPNRFYFVLPDRVLAIVSVPEWAGIYRFAPWQPRGPWRVKLTRVRAAPLLHRQPVGASVRSHMMSVFYWRFHHAFIFNRYEGED